MSEQRFVKDHSYLVNYNKYCILDNVQQKHLYLYEVVGLLNEQQSTIIELQEIIIELKDDKNQLHKVISKLRQEVAELKTRNAVLSSKLNRIPKSIREVWLDE